MALNACLILKDNKILTLKDTNIFDLPYIEIDDHDKVEILLKKYIKDILGVSIEIIQIFNTYQITRYDRNANVNVYEASLINGKLNPKNNLEVFFLSLEELKDKEVSETLKFVISEL